MNKFNGMFQNTIDAGAVSPVPPHLLKNFLVAMSYELRNPLNAIHGISQVLKDSNDLDRETQQGIADIYQSSCAIVPLLEHCQYFLTRQQTIDNQPQEAFDLLRLLENEVERQRQLVGNYQPEIIIHYREDAPRLVEGDKRRLMKVLAFLLNNALRFTERGHIAMHVTYKKMNKSRGFFSMVIKDTGRGMAPDKLARVFDLFDCDEPDIDYQQCGLRLSICKEMMSHLGGQISIQSELDKGTSVRIALPLIIQEKQTLPNPVHWDEHRDVRILVVSEHRVLGAYIHSFIPSVVNAVVTAQQALRHVQQAAAEGLDYQVVILDESSLTEQRSAIMALMHATSKHQALLYVALVQNEDAESITDLTRQGAVACIKKPLLPSNFLKQLIYHWIAYRNKREVVKIPSPSAPCILLVEDNKTNITVARLMLEGHGCRVEVAQSGAEALAKVKDMVEPYQMILLDIGLPDKSGFAVARQLRTLLPANAQLPILALTAYVEKTHKEKCFAAGMQDVIEKPIIMEKLLQKIDRFL